MLSKDTLDRIVELGQPVQIEIGGRTYSSRKLERIRPPSPDALQFHSLSALVDYLRKAIDSLEKNTLAVVIGGPAKVSLVSHLDLDHAERHTYTVSQLLHGSFPFGQFMDQENFVISLQTLFAEGGARDELIRLAGAITADEIQTSEDDGVSQTVTARAGVVLRDRVKLPSPVLLRPFRTFREIQQPESSFILRVKRGHAGPLLALFEADGGAWQIAAVDGIRTWLTSRLPAGPAILG